MKRAALLLVLFASPAFADLVTEDVANCHGLTAGAACTAPDGSAGTCVESIVSRPDYSQGVPPKYNQVKTLRCQSTANAQPKISTAWLGLGMAFIALVIAIRTRRNPQPA